MYAGNVAFSLCFNCMQAPVTVKPCLCVVKSCNTHIFKITNKHDTEYILDNKTLILCLHASLPSPFA